jgi:uncharacterized membrane protein YphA (DoxX/SURF4 family)
MTDQLAQQCERAVHVITPDGSLLRAGRASLYVMDVIGWHRFAASFSTRSLVWLAELVYWLVASHREWASRFLFRSRSAADRAGAQVDAIRLTLCLAVAGGMLFSPSLWVSSRSFPTMPVWAQLPALPFPLDYVLFAALIVLLGVTALSPRPRWPLAATVLLAVVLGVLDQCRWQPWFYQDLFMLGALAVYYWRRDVEAAPNAELDRRSVAPDASDTSRAALNSCRLVVISVYFWSGLHKINRSFVRETFPWFLRGISFFPSAALPYVSWLGYAVPLMEIGTGVGLLITRWRRPAIVAAILTHTFILVALGPLGRNDNQVVWVWNLAMIPLVVLLFRARPGPFAREILSPAHGWYHAVVLVLFAILPPLSFVYLWDSYLSFALYSANIKTARVYVSDGIRNDLSPAVAAYVRKADEGRNELDFMAWSGRELKVPLYPQARIYQGVARYACRYAKTPTDVELVVEQRAFPALLRSLLQLRVGPNLKSTNRDDCESLGVVNPDVKRARTP